MALERTIILISWVTSRVFFFVERQDVVDVGFHFSSSYQHEVQYEDQYKQVDGKGCLMPPITACPILGSRETMNESVSLPSTSYPVFALMIPANSSTGVMMAWGSRLISCNLLTSIHTISEMGTRKHRMASPVIKQCCEASFHSCTEIDHLFAYKDVDSECPSNPPRKGVICRNKIMPSPIMIIIREYFQYFSFIINKRRIEIPLYL